MNESSKKPNLVRAIVLTGLVAGTMDIVTATSWFTIRTGNNPVRVLEYISSAAFDKDLAYSGNILMIFLGLLFHYLIAYSWTFLFYLAYPRIGLLRANKFVVGIGYGILVWTIMNRVVLPLSRIPAITFDINQASIAASILIVCIGLPISIMASRYYSGK